MFQVWKPVFFSKMGTFKCHYLAPTKMADDSASSASRKPRKCNFSAKEVDVLVQLITKNAKCLFDRTPHGMISFKRKKAWDDVLRGVNAVSIERRTLDEIKNKWKKCRATVHRSKNIHSECKCCILL